MSRVVASLSRLVAMYSCASALYPPQPMTIVGAVAGTISAKDGNMIMEVEKRVFSIAEFCSRFGVGRTTAYGEIKAGRLQVVKAGKRTLVPADEAEFWLKNLPAAQAVS